MAGVTITNEVKIDTLRNETFAGTYDDISSYVIAINEVAGFTKGQDTFHAISEPMPPPAQMQIVLDNRSKVFHQETLGSELLANGDFASWSGGLPTSWTSSSVSTGLYEINEMSQDCYRRPDTDPACGGTGAVNFFTFGTVVSISQSVLTIGTTYKVTIDISAQGQTFTSGWIAAYDNTTIVSSRFHLAGRKTFYFTATSTVFKIATSGLTNITVDTISVKAVARYTGLLKPGVLIRWRQTYDGVTKQRFIGKITEGGITYGTNDKSGNIADQSVTVIVQDAMLDLVDIEYPPPLLTNVTTVEVIQDFFDTAVIPWPYAANYWLLDVEGSSELELTTVLYDAPNLVADTGQTTFTFSGNTSDRGKGVQAQQYLRDVVMAEGGGRLYFDPADGNWVFCDRNHDILNNTVVTSVDSASLQSMQYVYGDDLINKITVNYTAREIGAVDSILYTSQTNPVRVDAKSTRKITGRYTVPGVTGSEKRIGGYNFKSINSPAEYSLTSNRAVDCSISAEGKATSVDITIENRSTEHVNVGGLKFRGTPLIWYEESVTVANAQSIREYDERNKQPLTIKMLDDPNFAYSLAEYITQMHGTPIARVDSITFVANLNATNAANMHNARMDDRITVTNTYLNHDEDYIIIGEGHTVAADTRDQITTWYLKPVERETIWVLDEVGKSELGITTRLGL